MFIRLCLAQGIVPICTVRREEQETELKNEFSINTVFCSKHEGFMDSMKEACRENKTTVCFECIGGESTGQMLNCMGEKAVCIIYGLLSGPTNSAIDTIRFITLDQKIEGFYLGVHLKNAGPAKTGALIGKAMSMYGKELSTVIQAKLGFHQVKEAIELYQTN